jgi:thioredoxin-related protein
MKNILVFTILMISFAGCKNSAKEGELTWLTIEEASELGSKSNKKKFLVDVYTDWCGWCKVMDKKTFTDPELIKYLNENFHVVKFNAEQKESVTFKGKTYTWEPMGRNGINTLGLELLQNRMSYPSLVYLNENLEPITVSPGYKEPAQLMSELQSL